MKVTTDTKQRMKTGAGFFLEFYKVMMGTFLATFVPQKCGDHVCSITENIENTEELHFMANISNLVTFVVVLAFYIVEMNRENWSITYLDIDPKKPNNNLDLEIEYYPKIKDKMYKLNRTYLHMIYACIGFLSVNFVLSGVAIGYDYVGTNTLTSLLSFFILIAQKFSSAVNIGQQSVKEERAFSAYMQIARTYNTIDKDHRLPYSSPIFRQI
jgi:hypothetical protein